MAGGLIAGHHIEGVENLYFFFDLINQTYDSSMPEIGVEKKGLGAIKN